MNNSAKDLLREAMDNLPDDATVEEAIERLVFLAAVDEGIADADGHRTLSHEEVKTRLGL